MDKINTKGAVQHRTLQEELSLENFLRCSQEFSEALGLLTPECRAVLEIFNSFGLAGGMQFFGNGVFTIGSPELTEKIEKELTSRNLGGQIIRCGLEPKGFRYL